MYIYIYIYIYIYMIMYRDHVDAREDGEVAAGACERREHYIYIYICI